MKKINLDRDAHCGNTPIPAGEYNVSVRMDSRQINLEGQGRDFELNAIRRPSRGMVRFPDVHFSPSGGLNNWTLLVKTPKLGEYLTTISYNSCGR